MIAAILFGLLKANLAASVAVLAVRGLRKPVRARFGARAAYALWLAPLIGAAAILLPHPPSGALANPIVRGAQAAVSQIAEQFVAQAPGVTRRADLDIAPLLLGLWLAGALAAAGLVLRRQSQFVAAMGALTPAGTPGVFRAQNPDVGPAVVGAWRPRIVAPADFETRFAPDERRLILAHEDAHLRTGDARINALVCALQCLGWFNPLVHLGVRALRIDQELACDAAVIGRFPDARRAYAELLLKSQIATQPLPLGCHWPASADHPLKERITMLKSPLPRVAKRTMGLAVASLLSVGIGGLAWAAQPEAGSPVEAVQRIPHVAGLPDTAQPAPARTPVSYAPGGYTPRPGFAEPRTNGQAPRAAAFVSIWLKKPTGDELVRLYPADAAAQGLTADVVLVCKVGADGRLDTCDVSRVAIGGAGAPDNPADDPGFRAATLELAKLFQMKPVDLKGARTAGTTIHIPIMFRLPHDAAPSAN